MEREFKFGQYVMFNDNIVDAPKHPCRIDHRFFDGENNMYVVNIGEGKCNLMHEKNLSLFVGDYNEFSFIQVWKEISRLHDYVTKLESELKNIKSSSNIFTSSIQEEGIKKEQGDRICLPKE